MDIPILPTNDILEINIPDINDERASVKKQMILFFINNVNLTLYTSIFKPKILNDYK